MRRFFNTTMSSELKDFVRKVITIKGGVAEPGREDEERLNILLSSELQKKLSLEEYEALTFSSGLPGKLVAYGSPFLDKITSLTEDMGGLLASSCKDSASNGRDSRRWWTTGLNLSM